MTGHMENHANLSTTSTIISIVNQIVNATTKCTKHLKKHEQNYAAAADHTAHMSSHDGMMAMTFHGGFKETILFDFWKTNSVGYFVLSCFILFAIGVFYEGIKLARECLYQYELTKNQKFQLLRTSNTKTTKNCQCEHDKLDKIVELPSDHPNNEEIVSLAFGDATKTSRPSCCEHKKGVENSTDVDVLTSNDTNERSTFVVFQDLSSSLLSRGHLIQTFFHMFQLALSYLLMLVFMTYNTWLCLSVVLGAGLGYFLFGIKRSTSIDINEHCH